MNQVAPRDPKELWQAWQRLRASGERLHALEQAERLGVSEGELLASAVGGEGELRATRLAAEWPRFLEKLPALGTVKTVTRNPHAVIEVVGSYGNVEFFGPAMGQSVSSIDLRIFPTRWKHGFVVEEETKDGPRRSLQFFDASGSAIHKLYVKPETDGAAFDALVRAHVSEDQRPTQAVSAPEPAPAVLPDEKIDVAGLRAGWRAMTDTHQFFGLLREHQVARTQALRLVGTELAERLEASAFARLLQGASASGLPIMFFIGNPGLIQIRTGAIHRVVEHGPWWNVIDPGFDLHVRADRIEQAWLVRKPTTDGIVTSVELYDAGGQQLALVVGQRKPGIPESPDWRALAESLRAPTL